MTRCTSLFHNNVQCALVKMLNARIAEFGSCSVNLVLEEGALVFLLRPFRPMALRAYARWRGAAENICPAAGRCLRDIQGQRTAAELGVLGKLQQLEVYSVPLPTNV
jgi:hypothetical protein